MTKRLWCYSKPSFSVFPSDLRKAYVSQIYLTAGTQAFINSLVYNPCFSNFSKPKYPESQVTNFQIKKIAV